MGHSLCGVREWGDAIQANRLFKSDMVIYQVQRPLGGYSLKDFTESVEEIPYLLGVIDKYLPESIICNMVHGSRDFMPIRELKNNLEEKIVFARIFISLRAQNV